MVTEKPVFIKEEVMRDVKEFVDLRTSQGYTVKSKIMFFTSLHGTRPKEVKVLVSSMKVDPHSSLPKMCILRGDGTWR